MLMFMSPSNSVSMLTPGSRSTVRKLPRRVVVSPLNISASMPPYVLSVSPVVLSYRFNEKLTVVASPFTKM